MKQPRSCAKYKVEFAEEPYEFEVKPQNVRGSVVADSENCAAACALKALPDVTRAWVNRTRTIIEFADGKVCRWRNPASLQQEIEKFDTTAGLFPPGKYRLQVVGTAQRATKRRNKNTGKKKPALSRKRPSYALR